LGSDDVVGVDFFGGLSESLSGNWFILFLTDAFTGFTILSAVPDQTGPEVVKVLEQQLTSVFLAPWFLAVAVARLKAEVMMRLRLRAASGGVC